MANVIRTALVDDEPVARRGVRGLLEVDEEVEVVGEAANGAEAVALVHAQRPDLLLLDVQMPGLDGFEVLARVEPQAMPVVVFVTAHDAFALKAFEAQALDYLLKPFDDDRFRTVLERAKRHVRMLRGGGTGLDPRLEGLLRQLGPRHPMARIMVKDGGAVFFQPVEEIDWIEAADYFVKLHVGGTVHLVAETMAALEARLDPARFLRVHRSAIVNLARVRELRPDYRNRHIIVLANGERVPLSRGRRVALEMALSGDGGA